MKKRLLSALLALALVFVLLPTTALAGVTTESDYDISINGTNYVFSDSETCYFKSSFTSTEPSSPYLKLTKSSDTITVTVSGYVTVSDISVHNNFSTQDKINLIITGNKGSTLNIECKDTYGAALETYQSGDITIKGGITVNANFSANNTNRNTDCHGISASKNLIITGKGTTVNAVNADHDAAAVKVGGNITVSDGAQLNATNKYYGSNNTDKAYAIKCGQLSISGNNTKVTAKTSNGKQAISGTVSNGDKLTFKVPLAGSTLHQKPMDEALGYAYVEITQAPTDPYVFIAGEPAIMGQETPIPGGSGTYLYVDAGYDGNILTLKDATVNKTDSIKAVQAIRFGQNGYYTIKLEGENKISGFSSGIVAPNDSGVNNVTVVLSGSGSLDISANQYAIDMQVGNLKFENTGTIKLTTGYNYYVNPLNALRVKTGNISIDNTKYDIVGARQEKNYPTETISDSSAFTPDLLNGYTVGETTTLFKTITITPAAAKPSTIRYNGTTLKQGETIKDGKGGTATVDRENNTITLNNFKGTKALSFEATLADSTLVLEGTSTLSSIVTTQKGLTISGSGSLTVGSIRVTNNDNISADLTITDGAAVIAGTATSDAKAIDITGNLTVNSGATLTATNTSETKPTIDVTGNVTISGNPGTNAYTVSAHNSYNVQKDRVGNLSPSGVPSAIKIGGTLNISAGARVMAQTDSYGAGVMLGQNSTITVEDAFLSAKNSSCDFAAISFSGQTGKIYVSGEKGKVVAENIHTGTNLKFRAINAFVYNSNTNFYLKMQSEGVIAEAANKIIAPGKHDASGGKKVTITRGDEVTRTNSPVVIAGTTLLNDTYYTITNGSKVAEGTENNYNAFYNSKTKTLKLNNAQISHSFAHENGGGRDGAIIFTKFENYFIELSGENTISSTNTYAINCHRPDRTLTIKNAAGAENAKLTLTSNWMVVCSIGGLNIQSDVTMVNTKEAGYLMYVNDTFSFDGYNAYASVNASGSPLVEYTVPTSGDKDAGYQYLRITKETLETGGGSTHEHVFSTSWESNADYHWHKCTVQGCTEVSDKEAHVYTNTWWKNSNGNHGRTCDKCRHEGEIHEFRKYYDFVDATYHVERCSYPNCTYVGSNETHSYDSFGVCKCGYSPNGLPAPPSLQGVAPTSENGTDGKILNSNIGMEYAQNLNGPWTKWNEHSNITGLSAGTYYVRYTKTDERFPDNQVATVEVPAYTPGGDPTPDIPAAPTGLVGVAPTSENGNGKITGTTAQMEYASSLEGDWTTCANDSTDVPAGKYYVRMKKTDNTPAGEAVEVTVPAYSGTGEITPDPTPDNPGTIVIIRPAEEEKPAQQPNPSTGANDLVGLAVAAAVAAALGSAALLRKHD